MPNVFDKEKYVIHYETVEIYLRIQSVSIVKIICQI